MANRIAAALAIFLIGIQFFVTARAVDPCSCDGFWPHKRTQTGQLNCDATCGAGGIKSGPVCSLSAWCQECQTTGLMIWCVPGQCGFARLRTVYCFPVDPD